MAPPVDRVPHGKPLNASPRSVSASEWSSEADQLSEENARLLIPIAPPLCAAQAAAAHLSSVSSDSEASASARPQYEAPLEHEKRASVADRTARHSLLLCFAAALFAMLAVLPLLWPSPLATTAEPAESEHVRAPSSLPPSFTVPMLLPSTVSEWLTSSQSSTEPISSPPFRSPDLRRPPPPPPTNTRANESPPGPPPSSAPPLQGASLHHLPIPALAALACNGTSLSTEPLPAIPHPSKATVSAFLRKAGVASLADLRNRTECSLLATDSDCEVLAWAASKGILHELQELNLRGSRIENAGVRAFSTAFSSSTLSKLRTLHLASNKIGTEGLRAFADALSKSSLDQLRTIYLPKFSVVDDGRRSLRSDEVENRHLDDADMSIMSKLFSNGAWSQLTGVGFRWNGIGDAGLQAFSCAISKGALPELTYLDFSMNHMIGDAGLQAFAGALFNDALHKLKELRFDSNRVGDAGLKAFSSALLSHHGALTQLEGLFLGENNIGVEGIQAFSNALSKGTVLKRLRALYLQGNHIGDVGLQAFTAAITKGVLHELVDLHLGNNEVGPIGLKALSTALSAGALSALRNVWVHPGTFDSIAEAVSVRHEFLDVCSKRKIKTDV